MVRTVVSKLQQEGQMQPLANIHVALSKIPPCGLGKLGTLFKSNLFNRVVVSIVEAYIVEGYS